MYVSPFMLNTVLDPAFHELLAMPKRIVIVSVVIILRAMCNRDLAGDWKCRLHLFKLAPEVGERRSNSEVWAFNRQVGFTPSSGHGLAPRKLTLCAFRHFYETTQLRSAHIGHWQLVGVDHLLSVRFARQKQTFSLC